MVDAYATTHGSVTLAVDSERFLFEESESNIVLSLHPAITLREGARPRPFGAVRSFTADDDGLSVQWQEVEGWQASTHLRRLDDHHYVLRFSLTNATGRPARPVGAHPLCFSPEGPGACGLGFERLRTWASHEESPEPALRRVHGAELRQAGFGLWFAESGSPLLLMGARGGMVEGARQVVFSGVRGKIASMRIDEALPEGDIAPGETWGPAEWLVAFGDLDVVDELRAWARSEGASAPEFDPMGEPEPDPEVVEEEPDLTVEEPEEEEDEEDEEEEIEETASESDENEDAEESDAPVADEADSEVSEVPVAIAEERVGRCAEFHRAWRRTRQHTEDGEGFWPRWAAGRAYPPIHSTSTRTRDRWRRDH